MLSRASLFTLRHRRAFRAQLLAFCPSFRAKSLISPPLTCAQAASIKIHGLLTLSSVLTCSKTFFKANRAQIKWNDLGTQAQAPVVTQTKVDDSNTSCYGETSMYLVSVASNFDCYVALDKE